MGDRLDFLRNSLIVGAHPDDELLWFNAILKGVDRVVIVYRDFWAQPHLGEARRAALAEYPRGNVTCLGIPEAGAYGCADWSAPVLSPHGIAFSIEASRRAVTRLARKSLAVVRPGEARGVAPDTVSRSYAANYQAVYDKLRPMLSADMNVFTHNPWGEYGHEEHIQVFRALSRLRDEIGFRLWMSNYCTERAMTLAMRYFAAAPGGYIRLPTDKDFADEVADVYRKHGCWTWADDWAWFDEECYMEAPRTDGKATAHQHLFPLNFFTIEAAPPKNWLPVALTMSAASAALAVTLSEAI